MAALRKARIRIITKEDTKKLAKMIRSGQAAERWAEEIARKEKLYGKGRGRPKETGRLKTVIQIVATTAQEAVRPDFKTLGSILVFDPRLAIPSLAERIRRMNEPQNWELWYHPRFGIRYALRTKGVKVPIPPHVHKLGPERVKKYIPVDLLDLEQTEVVPAITDKRTGAVIRPRTVGTVRPYEKFIYNIWIPKFLLTSSLMLKGDFPSERKAMEIGKMFLIDVDPELKKSSWITVPDADTTELSKRSVHMSDEGFQSLLEAVKKLTMAQVEAGVPIRHNWEGIGLELRKQYGGLGPDLLVRLQRQIRDWMQSEGLMYT